MSNSRLFRAAKKYRERLNKAEEKALKEMKRAYTASLSSTLNDLNKLEIQINKMIENGSSDFEMYDELKNWYEKRINDITDKINQFSKSAIEITKINQEEAVIIGNDYAVENLNAALGKPPVPIDINIISLDTNALEQFVGLSSDGSPLQDLFDSITTTYGNDIKDIISNGILTGKNPKSIAREIKISTGMPRYRAETIARTESHRAARAASIQNYSKNSSLTNGYIRICSGDSRTCPACFALHKTEYSLNKIMPTHPNCRCIVIPKVKTWAELTGDPTIPEVSDKIPTAEQLFNKLSDKDKRIVLGPERYKLYLEGTGLKEMIGTKEDDNWGPTTRIKPLRDLR